MNSWLLLQVVIAVSVQHLIDGVYLPISTGHERRVKKSSLTVQSAPGSSLLPAGSVSPAHGPLVRRPPNPVSITLQDLSAGTALPTEDAPEAEDHESLDDMDEEEHDEDFQAPARTATAGSSQPTSKKRVGPAKKIVECRRRPKIKEISMDGCRTMLVDFGYCQGACRSREHPGNDLRLSGDAFAFQMQRKCRTCRAQMETKHVQTRCSPPPNTDDNSYPQFHDRLTTVAFKVVSSCSCMRCS